MTPLDLTARPPRPARATLLGCAFLPRTIDKFRAEQPGGNPGGYFTVGPPATMTGYLLHKLKIDAEALRAVIASAADETEVVAWLRERIDPVSATDATAKMLAMRIDAMPPAVREQIARIYPIWSERPDVELMFDLIDLDDALIARAPAGGNGTTP